jgi:hypothetical protein
MAGTSDGLLGNGGSGRMPETSHGCRSRRYVETEPNWLEWEFVPRMEGFQGFEGFEL